MEYKFIGKEAALSALAGIPLTAPLVRQIDSIQTDKRFRKIEIELKRLGEFITENTTQPLEDSVLKLLKIIEDEGVIPGFSFHNVNSCMALMKVLNIDSKLGVSNDPFLSCEDCLQILNLDSKDRDDWDNLKIVTYELEKEDLIYRHVSANSVLGFHQVSPKDYFFCRTDRLFQKWDPMIDAVRVIQYISDRKQDVVGLKEIDDDFNWTPRRINSAVACLYMNNMIDDSHELGDAIVTGYVLNWVRLTEEALLTIKK